MHYTRRLTTFLNPNKHLEQDSLAQPIKQTNKRINEHNQRSRCKPHKLQTTHVESAHLATIHVVTQMC